MKAYAQLIVGYLHAKHEVAKARASYLSAAGLYETRCRRPLAAIYDGDTYNISVLVERAGREVYIAGGNAQARRVKCTARAIQHLRALERVRDKWGNCVFLLEIAVDCCGRRGGVTEIIRRKLATLGYSFDWSKISAEFRAIHTK